jgi:ribosome-associated protein
MREVEISKEPVELYKILKFEGIVSSGAEAKSMIAQGQVVVNGKVETRKRNKIMSGDVIECGQYKLHIKVK